MNWHIARVRAGWSTTAPTRIFETDPNRRNESHVERSLRDAGFDCYMPRERFERKSRRTHRIVTVTRPLFHGYIFVDQLAIGTARVHDCRGVAELMGEELDGRPWPVPAATVERFRQAEANLEFDDTREARIRRKQEGRTWRETLAMRFERDSTVRVTEGPFASFPARVAGITSQGMIRIEVNIFGRPVPTEMEAAWLEAA